MLLSDEQQQRQQQQQQQQQQNIGISNIITVNNVRVETGSHQKTKGEKDNSNDNDDRVVGINETSGMEKARRLRAVLGSKARRLRDVRLRRTKSGARSSSTEKVIANTTRLLSKYSSQQEKNKEEVLIEPSLELGIESSLLSSHTMALSPSSSLMMSGDNNNNNNNNNTNTSHSNNTNTITDMMVLSSAETTQAEITKEMTLLFESSGQASIELVDSGCDLVKAAMHSIEVFLMGSMIPATTTTTVTTTATQESTTATTTATTTTTTQESVASNNIHTATTTNNQVHIAPTRMNDDRGGKGESVRIRLQKEALRFYA